MFLHSRCPQWKEQSTSFGWKILCLETIILITLIFCVSLSLQNQYNFLLQQYSGRADSKFEFTVVTLEMYYAQGVLLFRVHYSNWVQFKIYNTVANVLRSPVETERESLIVLTRILIYREAQYKGCFIPVIGIPTFVSIWRAYIGVRVK